MIGVQIAMFLALSPLLWKDFFGEGVTSVLQTCQQGEIFRGVFLKWWWGMVGCCNSELILVPRTVNLEEVRELFLPYCTSYKLQGSTSYVCPVNATDSFI